MIETIALRRQVLCAVSLGWGDGNLMPDAIEMRGLLLEQGLVKQIISFELTDAGESELKKLKHD